MIFDRLYLLNPYNFRAINQYYVQNSIKNSIKNFNEYKHVIDYT